MKNDLELVQQFKPIAEVTTSRYNDNLFVHVEASVPMFARKPHTLNLVIDTSGSVKGAPLEYIKGAIKYILETLVDPNDYFAIIAYSDRPTVIVDKALVRDWKNHKEAINNLEAKGGTVIRSGLKAVRHPGPVFVLTDGEDSSPDSNWGPVVKIVNDKFKIHPDYTGPVAIYTLAFGSQANESYLVSLSEASGVKQPCIYIPNGESIKQCFTTAMSWLQPVCEQSIAVEVTLGDTIQQHDFGRLTAGDSARALFVFQTQTHAPLRVSIPACGVFKTIAVDPALLPSNRGHIATAVSQARVFLDQMSLSKQTKLRLLNNLVQPLHPLTDQDSEHTRLVYNNATKTIEALQSGDENQIRAVNYEAKVANSSAKATHSLPMSKPEPKNVIGIGVVDVDSASNLTSGSALGDKKGKTPVIKTSKDYILEGLSPDKNHFTFSESDTTCRFSQDIDYASSSEQQLLYLDAAIGESASLSLFINLPDLDDIVAPLLEKDQPQLTDVVDLVQRFVVTNEQPIVTNSKKPPSNISVNKNLLSTMKKDETHPWGVIKMADRQGKLSYSVKPLSFRACLKSLKEKPFVNDASAMVTAFTTPVVAYAIGKLIRAGKLLPGSVRNYRAVNESRVCDQLIWTVYHVSHAEGRLEAVYLIDITSPARVYNLADPQQCLQLHLDYARKNLTGVFDLLFARPEYRQFDIFNPEAAICQRFTSILDKLNEADRLASYLPLRRREPLGNPHVYTATPTREQSPAKLKYLVCTFSGKSLVNPNFILENNTLIAFEHELLKKWYELCDFDPVTGNIATQKNHDKSYRIQVLQLAEKHMGDQQLDLLLSKNQIKPTSWPSIDEQAMFLLHFLKLLCRNHSPIRDLLFYFLSETERKIFQSEINTILTHAETNMEFGINILHAWAQHKIPQMNSAKMKRVMEYICNNDFVGIISEAESSRGYLSLSALVPLRTKHAYVKPLALNEGVSESVTVSPLPLNEAASKLATVKIDDNTLSQFVGIGGGIGAPRKNSADNNIQPLSVTLFNGIQCQLLRYNDDYIKNLDQPLLTQSGFGGSGFLEFLDPLELLARFDQFQSIAPVNDEAISAFIADLYPFFKDGFYCGETDTLNRQRKAITAQLSDSEINEIAQAVGRGLPIDTLAKCTELYGRLGGILFESATRKIYSDIWPLLDFPITLCAASCHRSLIEAVLRAKLIESHRLLGKVKFYSNLSDSPIIHEQLDGKLKVIQNYSSSRIVDCYDMTALDTAISFYHKMIARKMDSTYPNDLFEYLLKSVLNQTRYWALIQENPDNLSQLKTYLLGDLSHGNNLNHINLPVFNRPCTESFGQLCAAIQEKNCKSLVSILTNMSKSLSASPSTPLTKPVVQMRPVVDQSSAQHSLLEGWSIGQQGTKKEKDSQQMAAVSVDKPNIGKLSPSNSVSTSTFPTSTRQVSVTNPTLLWETQTVSSISSAPMGDKDKRRELRTVKTKLPGAAFKNLLHWVFNQTSYWQSFQDLKKIEVLMTSVNDWEMMLKHISQQREDDPLMASVSLSYLSLMEAIERQDIQALGELSDKIEQLLPNIPAPTNKSSGREGRIMGSFFNNKPSSGGDNPAPHTKENCTIS